MGDHENFSFNSKLVFYFKGGLSGRMTEQFLNNLELFSP